MLVGEIITNQVVKSINNGIGKMGFGCLSHPGASTIGSQLLDVPMAGKSWQPSKPGILTHAHVLTPLTTRETQALFVDKLHLTAFI